jgi:methylenetetrahydrofolate reductase (NADPH)
MTVPTISFEFFPPKSLEAGFHLWEAATELEMLDPKFVSVTYGAGGTTRQRTHEVVKTLIDLRGLDVAAHLTCVDATKAETLAIADNYAKAGVKRIVALRGDPSGASESFTATSGGFSGSVDLVRGLAAVGDFEIIVSAYPERHPEAASATADIDMLKAKVDAGATSAITQFFFDTEAYLRFRDGCIKAGVDIPIIPGILPIDNWLKTRNFATKCGTAIPQFLHDAFDKAMRDDRHDLLSIAIGTEICADLLAEGVKDLHFYTLNKPRLTREICLALGCVERAYVLKSVA